MNRPMYLAVDYDDTLFMRASWTNLEGKPNEEMVNLVRTLQDRNWKIILWTSRNGVALEEAKEWCKNQGIRIDFVNENPEAIQWFKEHLGFVDSAWSNKAFADIYLDDSAFNSQTLTRVGVECSVKAMEGFCEQRYREKVLGEKWASE